MKPFLSVAAVALLLVSLSASGCAKAKASRIETMRAKSIASTAPIAVEKTSAAEIASSIPLPAIVQEAAPVVVKRSVNPNLPVWQQLEPDMTKDEVEQFVGRPNAKSEMKWVYRNGASIRFTEKGLLASYDAPRR